MKTTLDILVAARALIEKPENWCQGELSNGKGAYCARGAIIVADDDFHQQSGPLHMLATALPENVMPGFSDIWRVVDFNNSHTHPEVLALFDRAIAAEKRKLGIIDDKIAGQVRDLLANAVASTAVPESVA